MDLIVTAQETYYHSADGVNTRAVRGERVAVEEKQARKLIQLGVAAEPESDEPAEDMPAEKPAAKLASKPPQDQPGQ